MTFRTLALLAALILPGAALADRIDGDWCAPDGIERVSIEGDKITVAAGREIIGAYGRHEFLYELPAESDGAGTKIYMRQLSEEDVEVYRGEAAPVVWHRCQAVVS
ncbi:MAG: hypothetical protein KDK10_01375 [Maritimibacter sp.]|nr:hypothetical protein [Maritimibacter sp.]